MKYKKWGVKCQKRTIKCQFGILLFLTVLEILLFSGFFGFSVADAESSSGDVKADLSDVTGQTVQDLNLDAFSAFIKSLSSEQQSALGIKELVGFIKQAAAGGSGDFFSVFWQALSEAVKSYFVGFLPSCITIIVVCLLKNMLSGMTGNFLDNSTTEIVHLVCYSLVVVVIMVGVTDVVTTALKTVNDMTSLSAVLFPLLLTMLSALGGATGVSAYQPLMAVMSGTVLGIIDKVVLPAFIACIVFSVVGNLSKNVKLQKMTKLFRSGAGWLIGIVFGLFGTFLTLGGISGGIIDRVGYNAAKFAVSSYVPILGGYLSDGFDLVTASLVLVKNALGYTGVLVLVAVVAFPLVKIILFSLSLRLTAAVVEPIGDERVSNMLTAAADNISLLVAALAGAAFMFFMIIMLVLGTCNF